MPEKPIAKFEIKYLQVLDEKGKCDKKLEPKLPKEELIKLYKLMILTRTFDEISLKLQREGRMGTYASTRGQEAQVAIGLAMQKQDWLFPSFREHGVFLARDIPAKLIMLYFMGSEEGNKMPEGNNTLPIYIPVGSQIPQAVGAAMAAKFKGDKAAAVTVFGDGATSEGEFHEAMNFAGVFQAPCVFVCQNNQWAISVPVSKQTASKSIAQKAIAYGFEGIQADGNDILAMYLAMKKALDKARNGKGPTLIEMKTYRLESHTTADDPTRYRTNKELDEWKKKDPILRFRNYLKGKKILNEKLDAEIQSWAKEEINKAVNEAESMPKPNAPDLFIYVYGSITKNLEEEMKEWQNSQ